MVEPSCTPAPSLLPFGRIAMVEPSCTRAPQFGSASPQDGSDDDDNWTMANPLEEVRRSTATQLAAKNENAGSLQDHEDPIDLDIDLEYGEVETLLSGGERSGDTDSKPAEVKKAATQGKIRAQNLLEVLSVSMDNTEVENAGEFLRRQLDNRPYGNSADAVNNHYVAWARAGAIDAVLDALRNHPRSERLALSCLYLLKQLSSCKWTRYLVPYSGAQRINKHGGVDAILKIMLMFIPSSEQNPQVSAGLDTDGQALLQEQACRLLCNLAHHNQDIRTKICQKSGEKTVKEVMEAHSNKPGVQDAGQDLLDRLYDRKNKQGHTH
mmetsp:Transcript_62687/g.91909  ORF Transcript_62687/g.91909 Transcript_62687/m.91909 type:complete len:324 (-) Transcript_62687:823-1794(-)